MIIWYIFKGLAYAGAALFGGIILFLLGLAMDWWG